MTHSKRKFVLFGNVRVLCVSALLCGLSVVIAWLCKTYLTVTVLGSGIRFTLENQPIILAGLWFGPWVGFVVGFASDFISTAVSQYGLGGINPLITLGAAVTGLTSGLVARYWLKKPGFKQVACATAAAHLLGSGLCKTLGLYLYHFYVAVTLCGVTFSSLWLRLPTYLIIGAAECYINYILTRNRTLSAQIERMCRS